MVLKKTKAWIELLKLGSVMKMFKQVKTFYRGIILEVLTSENFFDFLTKPRTSAEISTQFGYTEHDFLKMVLDVLTQDGVLEKHNGNYKANFPIDTKYVNPEVMTASMVESYLIYAKGIPNRFKGEFISFTGGFNLFNWDDSLVNRVYEQMRRAAFFYTDVFKRSGKFLDIGCGNGYALSRIWSYYYNRNFFSNYHNNLQIFAIDINEDLLKIAKNEFILFIKEHLNLEIEKLNAYSRFFPQFNKGSILEIPFEDNTFDIVYLSQVLHWTEAKKAISEVVRVCKPGGLIFGAQMFLENVNPYVKLLAYVVENAIGPMKKADFIRWFKEAGARKVETATKISVFKIIK